MIRSFRAIHAPAAILAGLLSLAPAFAAQHAAPAADQAVASVEVTCSSESRPARKRA